MTVALSSIQRIVEIDGAELAADVDRQLESAVVVDRLRLPDTFTLVFRDPERDILSRAKLQIGARVKVSTASVRGDVPELLVDGEVTSIEAEYDTLGTRAVVRGYDLSHRLAAGRRTAVYTQVKLSDIARDIASEAGLQADVDDSPGTVDHVLQANQSDLDFLYELARRAGFDCCVEGDTLQFKQPPESSEAPGAGDYASEDPLQLRWNDNLSELRARVSAVAQVANVQVRGWSVADKEAIVSETGVTATNAELDAGTTPAALADKIGGRTMVVVDHPVGTQDAADALAAARAEQVGSAAFEATAVAVGSPALKAGVAVNIAGVDPSLEGKWLITGSRHEFGNGTYKTHLEFTGRQDRSIHGLLTQGQGAGGRDRIYGVVIGIVTENEDPDEMGRVKLQFPWLDDNAVSDWARIAAPGAGAGAGVVWLPHVDDEVLVAFEHGDVSRPIVLGGLWNGRDTIPFDYGDLDSGAVTYSGFTTRTGHKISFWESSSESSIQLLTKGGAVNVVLDEQNSEVKVETTGKIILDAQGDVEIKAGGGIKLNATGNVEIKGATVALN